MNITHWTQLLPEGGHKVGEWVKIYHAKVSDMHHQRNVAQRRIEEFEEQFEQRLLQEYSEMEIRAAKKDFYTNHYSGPLQPQVNHIDESKQETYHIPGTERVISISDNDAAIIRSIRKLPASVRIKMMHLTMQDMQESFVDSLRNLRDEALSLLGQKWYWRETGDRCLFNQHENEALFGICITKRALAGYIRNNKLSILQLEKIVHCLSTDNLKSELYLKD